MTVEQVKQLVGNYGTTVDTTVESDGTRDLNVEYQQCRNGRPASEYSTVTLDFTNWNYTYHYVDTEWRVLVKGPWSRPHKDY
jgi:hypothetical protein